MARGRKAKDPKQKQYDRFQKYLDEEWRSAEMSKATPDVYKDIVAIALNNMQLEQAKKEDPDLANLREQLKTATEVYTEGTKVGKIRIEFLAETLKSRGENVPSVKDLIKQAANGEANE